jgi:hypothetical protein
LPPAASSFGGLVSPGDRLPRQILEDVVEQHDVKSLRRHIRLERSGDDREVETSPGGLLQLVLEHRTGVGAGIDADEPRNAVSVPVQPAQHRHLEQTHARPDTQDREPLMIRYVCDEVVQYQLGLVGRLPEHLLSL